MGCGARKRPDLISPDRLAAINGVDTILNVRLKPSKNGSRCESRTRLSLPQTSRVGPRWFARFLMTSVAVWPMESRLAMWRFFAAGIGSAHEFAEAVLEAKIWSHLRRMLVSIWSQTQRSKKRETK